MWYCGSRGERHNVRCQAIEIVATTADRMRVLFDEMCFFVDPCGSKWSNTNSQTPPHMSARPKPLRPLSP